MDVSKLYVGQEIKNYKELCELLGEKVKSGNAKISQLNNLELYVKLDKVGYKYIINEILSDVDIVLNKINNDKKSIYTKMLSLLLMNELSQNDFHIQISKSSLWNKLGLINENYQKGFRNQKKLAHSLNMGLEYVNEFYNLSNSNLSRILKTALDTLVRNRTIDYKVDIMVKHKDSKLHHIATPIDRANILKVDKICMDKFNIQASDINNKFIKNVNYEKLKNFRNEKLNELTNIEFHYNIFDIVTNLSDIESDKSKLTNLILSDIEKLNKTTELNNLIKYKLECSALSRFNSNLNSDSIRNNDYYVNHFKSLINEVISISNQTNEPFENNESNQINELDIIKSLPF